MFRRLLVISLITLAASLPALAGSRYETYSQLDSAASYFANRPVEVRCKYNQEYEEDLTLQVAWAYVYLWEDNAIFDGFVCIGALAIANDPPEITDMHKALGAIVLAHEAFHLRNWPGAPDEARTECKAIQHFKKSVRKLGGTKEVAERLLPYGLYFHWKLSATFPDYYLKSCQVPTLLP